MLQAAVKASFTGAMAANVGAVELVSFDAVNGATFRVKVKASATASAVTSASLSANLNVGIKMNAALKAMVKVGQTIKAQCKFLCISDYLDFD